MFASQNVTHSSCTCARVRNRAHVKLRVFSHEWLRPCRHLCVPLCSRSQVTWSGDILCWGNNSHGQCGIAPSISPFASDPISVHLPVDSPYALQVCVDVCMCVGGDSACLPVCLSACAFICLSLHLFVSVHISMSCRLSLCPSPHTPPISLNAILINPSLRLPPCLPACAGGMRQGAHGVRDGQGRSL
jgi:hypothetical protein